MAARHSLTLTDVIADEAFVAEWSSPAGYAMLKKVRSLNKHCLLLSGQILVHNCALDNAIENSDIRGGARFRMMIRSMSQDFMRECLHMDSEIDITQQVRVRSMRNAVTTAIKKRGASSNRFVLLDAVAHDRRYFLQLVLSNADRPGDWFSWLLECKSSCFTAQTFQWLLCLARSDFTESPISGAALSAARNRIEREERWTRFSRWWPETSCLERLIDKLCENEECELARLLVNESGVLCSVNAFLRAARCGKVNVISTMLDCGMHPDVQHAATRETALMSACAAFSTNKSPKILSVVQLLSAVSEDVHLRSQDRQSAFDVAVTMPNDAMSSQVLRHLLRAPSYKQDALNLDNLLQEAVLRDNASVCALLSKREAELDSDPYALLRRQRLFTKCKKHFVEALLQCKPLHGDVNALLQTSSSGHRVTLLHACVESAWSEKEVLYLLEKGADPLAKDEHGKTVLQVALDASSSKVLTQLLSAAQEERVREFLKGSEGRALLERAAELGWWMAIRAMLQRMEGEEVLAALARLSACEVVALTDVLHVLFAGEDGDDGADDDDEGARCDVLETVLQAAEGVLSYVEQNRFFTNKAQDGPSLSQMAYEDERLPVRVLALLSDRGVLLDEDPMRRVVASVRELHDACKVTIQLEASKLLFVESDDDSTISLSLSPQHESLELRGHFRGTYRTTDGHGLVKGRMKLDSTREELVLSGEWSEDALAADAMKMRIPLRCLCSCEECAEHQVAVGRFSFQGTRHPWTWTRDRDGAAGAVSGCVRAAVCSRAAADRGAWSDPARLRHFLERISDARVEQLVAEESAACSQLALTCVSLRWWVVLARMLGRGASVPTSARSSMLTDLYVQWFHAEQRSPALASGILLLLMHVLQWPDIVPHLATFTVGSFTGTCLQHALSFKDTIPQSEKTGHSIIDLLFEVHEGAGCWTLQELVMLCRCVHLDGGQKVRRVLARAGPHVFLAAKAPRARGAASTCALWTLLGRREWALAEEVLLAANNDGQTHRHAVVGSEYTLDLRNEDTLQFVIGRQRCGPSCRALKSKSGVLLDRRGAASTCDGSCRVPKSLLAVLLARAPRHSLARLRSSPLHMAIKCECWQLAHRIVADAKQAAASSANPVAAARDAGRVLNFPDSEGSTPLFLVAKAHVRLGASARAAAQRDTQVLEDGSRDSQDELASLLRELTEAGAMDTSCGGESALLLAVASGAWQLVRLLLAQPECVRPVLGLVSAAHGRTALQMLYAACHGKSELKRRKFPIPLCPQIVPASVVFDSDSSSSDSSSDSMSVDRSDESGFSDEDMEESGSAAARESPRSLQCFSPPPASSCQQAELRELLRMVLEVGARPNEILECAVTDEDWDVVRWSSQAARLSGDDAKAVASFGVQLHALLELEDENVTALSALLQPLNGTVPGKRVVSWSDASGERFAPLTRAVRKGWVATVELLLAVVEQGRAHLDAQDVFGLTALHHACSLLEGSDERGEEQAKRVIQLLLRGGADPNVVCKAGKTCWCVAAEVGWNLRLLAPDAGDASTALGAGGGLFGGKRKRWGCDQDNGEHGSSKKLRTEQGEDAEREDDEAMREIAKSTRRDDLRGVLCEMHQRATSATVQSCGLEALETLIPRPEWRDAKAGLARALDVYRPSVIDVLVACLRRHSENLQLVMVALSLLSRLAHLESGAIAVLGGLLATLREVLAKHSADAEVQVLGMRLVRTLGTTLDAEQMADCGWLSLKDGVVQCVLQAMCVCDGNERVQAAAHEAVWAVEEALQASVVSECAAAVVRVLKQSKELAGQRRCCETLSLLLLRVPVGTVDAEGEVRLAHEMHPSDSVIADLWSWLKARAEAAREDEEREIGSRTPDQRGSSPEPETMSDTCRSPCQFSDAESSDAGDEQMGGDREHRQHGTGESCGGEGVGRAQDVTEEAREEDAEGGMEVAEGSETLSSDPT